ncbi:MAG: TRAP transporter substrate-binding protein DctP [Casimicrobiaceae bacterium]
MTKTIFRTAAVCAGVCLALQHVPAMAQGKTVLKFADSLPANHLFTESVAKPWMEEVRKRTNGAVEFQHYPAEQLGKGKDMLTLAQSGVTDIALIVPPYLSDKLPLSGVVELPGGFTSSCQGVKGLWKIANGGTLDKAELAPSGMRLLFAIVQPPFQIYSTKKLDTLKDLEGQKLRTTGGAMDLMVRKLKGAPVRMAAPEVYESLSRGTIDGGVLAVVSVGSYNLGSLVKYGTQNENFGSAALLYEISETAFKKLSPDVQKAMVEAGQDITFKACSKIDEDAARDNEKMRANGVKLGRIAAADHPAMEAAMTAVGAEWAEGLDKRGKPGSVVLREFRQALQ